MKTANVSPRLDVMAPRQEALAPVSYQAIVGGLISEMARLVRNTETRKFSPPFKLVIIDNRGGVVFTGEVGRNGKLRRSGPLCRVRRSIFQPMRSSRTVLWPPEPSGLSAPLTEACTAKHASTKSRRTPGTDLRAKTRASGCPPPELPEVFQKFCVPRKISSVCITAIAAGSPVVESVTKKETPTKRNGAPRISRSTVAAETLEAPAAAKETLAVR